MKTKQLLCLILVSITAVASYAQDAAFGVKGGVNLSTFNIDDAEATYDSRTGFHAGVFLRGKFNKVAIQPELLLSTLNSDIRSSIFGTAQDRFTYLTIPVMVKLYPVGGLNLQLGPQFGFLLDGERKYDTFFGAGSADIKDHYKSSDISLAFGAGYDFNFGLGLDFRYNLGIKDINNAANGEDIKSRVIMISLGWNFIN